MSTVKQDNDFRKAMESEMEAKIEISGSALDTAVDFIASNFSPEDVFPLKDLEYWAEKNGFVKE